MEARLSEDPAGRLVAGDEQAVALGKDANCSGFDAGEVDDHLERLVGFEDVDGGGALAGQGVRPKNSAELEERPSDLVSKVPYF